ATTTGNEAVFTGVSLDEGAHTLVVAVSDAAGNPVVANAASLLVDVTPPTCVIAAPTAAVLTSADDEGAGAGLQVSFTITTDGAAARLLDGTDELGAGAASGSVALAGVTLAEGTRDLTAVCADGAG